MEVVYLDKVVVECFQGHILHVYEEATDWPICPYCGVVLYYSYLEAIGCQQDASTEFST